MKLYISDTAGVKIGNKIHPLGATIDVSLAMGMALISGGRGFWQDQIETMSKAQKYAHGIIKADVPPPLLEVPKETMTPGQLAAAKALKSNKISFMRATYTLLTGKNGRISTKDELVQLLAAILSGDIQTTLSAADEMPQDSGDENDDNNEDEDNGDVDSFHD